MVSARGSLLARKLSTAEPRVGLCGRNLSGDLKEPEDLELLNVFKDGRRRKMVVRGLRRGRVATEIARCSVSEGPSYWAVM